MTTTDIGPAAVDVTKAEPGDAQLVSVTTIIGVLHKEGLLYWSAEMAAEAAVDSTKTWQAMLETEGREAAVLWLRDARKRIPRYKLASTALGTVTHRACEEYALTGTKPPRDFVANLVRGAGGPQTDIDAETNVVGLMLNQFDTWLQRFTPTYQAAEVTVYDPRYGYAGTLDAILTIDGVRLITDYKTSRESFDRQGNPRGPYPEQVAPQLAAYRYADTLAVRRAPRRINKWGRRYYLLGPDEQATVPIPEVDTGLVIHITPEHCHAYPMRCDEPVRDAFLYLLEAFRWVDDASKSVMGEPLQ